MREREGGGGEIRKWRGRRYDRIREEKRWRDYEKVIQRKGMRGCSMKT